ncbi:MAG: EamA family transporter [Candidatus Riflebacteria bacterium]|nr:EamA family transporter [Candidatus Riflebacteria bacterium]
MRVSTVNVPAAGEGGNSNVFVLSVLALTQVITGGTYLVAKIALTEFDPFTLGLFRFLLAAAIFLPILHFSSILKLPEREDWTSFFLMALLAVPLNQGLFLFGMKFTSAGHGALLYATTPLLVMLLSFMGGMEVLNSRKVTGVILGFAGVAIVLSDRENSGGTATLTGDLLVFGAVLTWALYTLVNKRILKKYSPIFATGISLSLGALIFIPIGIPSLLNFEISRISSSGMLSLLYMAILTSVFAYLIWSWALKSVEATKVSVLSNLQPAVASALAWIFLNEPITLKFVLGFIVILCGVILTQRSS